MTKKGIKDQNDSQDFKDIKAHCLELKGLYAQRDVDFRAYEDMYLVRWRAAEEKKLQRTYPWITTSPDARNAVLGSLRLMIGSDPIFKITTQDLSFDKEGLESSVSRWFDQSGRIARRPIHFDMLLSAILYGEMHTAVTPMTDMLERFKEGDKRYKRIKRRSEIAPYLIESWNPISGYPEFDKFGLSGYFREVETTADAIINDFGDMVPDSITRKNRYDKVWLRTFYDLEKACWWVDNDLLIMDNHNWTEIPISVTLVDGTRLFKKPEEQRQPLLFSLLKSGLWEQQNLTMTIIYSMIFGMGATAMFEHTAPPTDASKAINLNFDGPVGIVELEPGETFAPILNKGTIPPELTQGMSLAEQKIQESTMYPTAFGQPPAHNVTFSEISLMSQAGRLPLVGPQRLGGEGIANVIELCLTMMEDDGEQFNKNGIIINPKDMPNDMQIECKLDVKLPQDKLQLANIANILKSAGLVDDEWIRHEILNVTDSNKMQERIWSQDAAKALFVTEMQKLVNETQQQQQQPGPGGPGGDQGGGPGGMPPGGMDPSQLPPGSMPANGMDPSQMAGPQMAQGQGQMVQGGLPPQMAGMMPGAGQGIMPQGGQ